MLLISAGNLLADNIPPIMCGAIFSYHKWCGYYLLGAINGADRGVNGAVC